MSSHQGKSKSHMRRFAHGQAAAELGGALLVLVPLLLAAADFGRLFYENITLKDAARAGAQYGSQSVTSAADVAGMRVAANSDATNLSGMTVTANQCTCVTTSSCTCPSGSVKGCATITAVDCTNAPAGASFVMVTTSATYKTIASYPGVPSSVNLTGNAVMMVEQ